MRVKILFGLVTAVLPLLLGTANADDVVPTLRIGTIQGPSAAVTAVTGGPFCTIACGGSAGIVLELEGGLGGVKGALGIGAGERSHNDTGLIALKGALFRSWSQPLLGPGDAIYLGPELDIVARHGISVGALKRLNGPGWRISLGVVRAF